MIKSQFGAMEDAPQSTAVSPPVGSSARPSIVVSLVAFVAHILYHMPAAVLVPVDYFDEGIRLSAPFFASRGLTIFQDFYIPYGPGNGYLGMVSTFIAGDSILANRVGLIVVAATLAALATYLVCRRRGFVAGLFVAVIAMSFFTLASYSMVYILLVAGATTLIGWTRDVHPLSSSNPEHERRLVIAGVLFALAAWFRFEFAFILAAWSVAVVTRPSPTQLRWPRVFWIPWLVGVAPYLLVLLRGGGDELAYALRYALVDFGTYRGLDADLSEPLDLVGQLLSNQPLNWEAFTIAMSFGAAWIGLIAIALGPLVERLKPSWRPFIRDRSRLILILASTAAFATYVLRVRADYEHASQLVLPVWLAIVWNPMRWRRVGVAAALVITSIVLVAGDANAIGNWHRAGVAWDASGDVPLARGGRVTFTGNDAAELADLKVMWSEIGAPDKVFVANRVNDLTHVNAVIVYWLLQAEPASWMTTFDPGFADQERFQRLMAEDLCGSAAPVVLAENASSPEHPADRRFSPYLDRFLALNYELHGRNAGFDLRLPRAEGCIYPDADPTLGELEVLRLSYVAERDLIPAAIIGEWQHELAPD